MMRDSTPEIMPVPKALNKNASEQVHSVNAIKRPMTKAGKMVTFVNSGRKSTSSPDPLLKGKSSVQTDPSLADGASEAPALQNKGRRGAIAAASNPDGTGAGGGQALLNSYQRTRKQKKKEYVLEDVDDDAKREGMLIQHPDMLKQEARDYLLIGRVVKRNCRPLTIAEAKHLQRNNVLFKLDAEIRDL